MQSKNKTDLLTLIRFNSYRAFRADLKGRKIGKNELIEYMKYAIKLKHIMILRICLKHYRSHYTNLNHLDDLFERALKNGYYQAVKVFVDYGFQIVSSDITKALRAKQTNLAWNLFINHSQKIKLTQCLLAEASIHQLKPCVQLYFRKSPDLFKSLLIHSRLNQIMLGIVKMGLSDVFNHMIDQGVDIHKLPKDIFIAACKNHQLEIIETYISHGKLINQSELRHLGRILWYSNIQIVNLLVTYEPKLQEAMLDLLSNK